KADVLPIQIFHLFIHLLSGLGVYFIICSLYPKTGSLNIPSLIGYTVYLFNPATLWFQSNVYMSDMFVQVFFVWAVAVCVRLLMNEHSMLSKLMYLLLLCFAMVYTSWLGIFFCLSAVILIFRGKLLFSLALIEILLTALVLGIGIAFLQYARIAGMENLKEELLCRFGERSSFYN